MCFHDPQTKKAIVVWQVRPREAKLGIVLGEHSSPRLWPQCPDLHTFIPREHPLGIWVMFGPGKLKMNRGILIPASQRQRQTSPGPTVGIKACVTITKLQERRVSQTKGLDWAPDKALKAD